MPTSGPAEAVRNETILRARLAERPDDPFALWHMGRLEASRGQWTLALELYRRCLAGWPSDLLADAPRAHLAQAEWELGNRRAASSLLRVAGAGSAPCGRVVCQGSNARLLGEAAEAERCWRQVLMLVCGNPTAWRTTTRASRHVGAAGVGLHGDARGDLDEAGRLYGMILAENPDDPRLQALNAGFDGRIGHDQVCTVPRPGPAVLNHPCLRLWPQYHGCRSAGCRPWASLLGNSRDLIEPHSLVAIKAGMRPWSHDNV